MNYLKSNDLLLGFTFIKNAGTVKCQDSKRGLKSAITLRTKVRIFFDVNRIKRRMRNTLRK